VNRWQGDDWHKWQWLAQFPLRMAKATMTQGLFFANQGDLRAYAAVHDFILTDSEERRVDICPDKCLFFTVSN
jgi:hypothetical protein